MTTAAAIDRLIHHRLIFELNVESYRMEQVKKGRNNLVHELSKSYGCVYTKITFFFCKA
jgi:hypothetical protein